MPTLTMTPPIRSLVVLLMATACATPAPAPARRAAVVSAPASDFSAVERGIVSELNAARTDPRAYARRLDALLPHYNGRLLKRPSDRVAIQTSEGTAAVREAAAALRAMTAMPAVARSGGMSRGAADHVRDQGPQGGTGHTDRDGSTTGTRVNRYGSWQSRLNESISYGPANAADVVAELLIDDGVRNRGHRHNLLDPAMRVAGVACGPHARYGAMCVIVLAAGYAER